MDPCRPCALIRGYTAIFELRVPPQPANHASDSGIGQRSTWLGVFPSWTIGRHPSDKTDDAARLHWSASCRIVAPNHTRPQPYHHLVDTT
ncbi:hypothetical protein VTK56DRAFT_5683 [Thermocarpiscus australiensis]